MDTICTNGLFDSCKDFCMSSCQGKLNVIFLLSIEAEKPIVGVGEFLLFYIGTELSAPPFYCLPVFALMVFPLTIAHPHNNLL